MFIKICICILGLNIMILAIKEENPQSVGIANMCDVQYKSTDEKD